MSGVSPLELFGNEGTAAYRFAWFSAKEAILVAAEVRNGVERVGESFDFKEAESRLSCLSDAFKANLLPVFYRGELQDREARPWRDDEWGIEAYPRPLLPEFAAARENRGPVSFFGLHATTAHGVVEELIGRTYRAFVFLAANQGDARLFLLSSTSILRTSLRGLGALPDADCDLLRAECQWEAETAWRRTGSACAPLAAGGSQTKAEFAIDPRAVAASPSGSVQLFGQSEPPRIRGESVAALSRSRYDVVLALLKAGDAGLTKDELDRRAGRSDARKILGTLARSDEIWNAVIRMPGTAGKRYRIT